MKCRPNPQRKNHWNRQKQKEKSLEEIHLSAEGIDIGSANHCVAVPEDRDDEAVRDFKSSTPDPTARPTSSTPVASKPSL